MELSVIKDWVSALASVLSVLVAAAALLISWWVSSAQRRIQERQLKQSLFDKRYAVFIATQAFLAYSVRTLGSIDLVGEEYRQFRSTLEQSQFLFAEEVIKYIKHLEKTVLDLWEKAVKRDHLAEMNQQETGLNSEINTIMKDLIGPLAERRTQVFSPYLQLSPSERLERSTVRMRLNGWKRLWIVVAVIWLLPVLILSFELWPKSSDVSKGDIYIRMKPDDGRRLKDYYDVVATQLGGTEGVPNDLMTKLRNDKDFLAASTKDQKAYLASVDPDFAKASLVDKNAYLGNITGLTGPTVDIEGHEVQFVKDVPQEEMNQTARAFDGILSRILRRQRATVLGLALAYWAIPVVAVYLLGLAFVWVRRGFQTPTA